MSVRDHVVLAGADEARMPVMTIAMFHEVRDAQNRLAERMIRERRGIGEVHAMHARVAADPLAAWHSLKQPFGFSKYGQ
jgi:hypothetical protein